VSDHKTLSRLIEALFVQIAGDIASTNDATLKACVVASFAKWWAGQLEGRLRTVVPAPTEPDGLQLLTMEQVAKRLAVSPRTVREMRHKGLLPVVYITDDCPRVTERDLEKWIQAKGGGPWDTNGGQ
jgi:excisionase family DNA binding protein